jgi:hypothetical protein
MEARQIYGITSSLNTTGLKVIHLEEVVTFIEIVYFSLLNGVETLHPISRFCDISRFAA